MTGTEDTGAKLGSTEDQAELVERYRILVDQVLLLGGALLGEEKARKILDGRLRRPEGRPRGKVVDETRDAELLCLYDGQRFLALCQGKHMGIKSSLSRIFNEQRSEKYFGNSVQAIEQRLRRLLRKRELRAEMTRGISSEYFSPEWHNRPKSLAIRIWDLVSEEYPASKPRVQKLP